ncbi:hypothetical protein GCM10009539_07140 [Cryptosporangium japonicum]|uniref:TIR domain-containing protein n=1 Tax=Cryptosporangium japonicum TaxID=80872 RepID=A0ABN0TLA4_9ACTN
MGGPRDYEVDFFLSYSSGDVAWANWVAKHLEAAGNRVLYQRRDFPDATSWPGNVDDALRRSRHMIALLSSAYFASAYCSLEWHAALSANLGATDRKLILLRVEDCPVDGVLGPIVRTDLFHVNEESRALRLLRDAVHGAITGRNPISPQTSTVPFPGGRAVQPSGRYRALILSIDEYQDTGLSSLGELRTASSELAAALEQAGYQLSDQDDALLTPSTIRRRILTFLAEAERGQTLVIVLAGHGGRAHGRNYLVPADAWTGDPDPSTQWVPAEWSDGIPDCRADRVLVIADLRLADPPGEPTGRPADRPGIAYFTHTGPKAATLLGAFRDSLVRRARPSTAAALEKTLRNRLPDPAALHVSVPGDPDQFVLLPQARSQLAPDELSAAWRALADEHPVWKFVESEPGYEDLHAATNELVEALARDRRRSGRRLGDDPWTDPLLASRMTGLVSFLVRATHSRGGREVRLSAAEAALFVVMPFVYETFWARTVADAASPDRIRLETRAPVGGSDGFPGFLKQHDRLVRRAERLRRQHEPEIADAIGWWLLHRWAAREPRTYREGRLTDLLDDLGGDPLAREVFSEQRLLSVIRRFHLPPGRAIGATAAGDAECTISATTATEQRLRDEMVGLLLAVAQRMANDVATLSGDIVVHLGARSPGREADVVDLDALAQTIREARWGGSGTAGRRLIAVCQHQAVHSALELQTQAVGAALAHAHTFSDRYPLLGRLPTHANADGLSARVVDERALYVPPGIRFRLAEDEVQELLMGEQLYESRALAIRELYQNALDACRHRRARREFLKSDDPWKGAITFTEGHDRGRPFIQCEDNGVGMGQTELAEVFAEAGRRSTDLPEVIDEMARWAVADPPVEFRPISRFGIGVLSYFMLADEITVSTRRFNPDGSFGEPLVITITGPGQLFRFEKGAPSQQAGTTVRLYLAERPGEAPISCVDVLQGILWIAEFTTSASDASSQLRWTPGELAPSAPVGATGTITGRMDRSTMTIADGGGTVWWCDGTGALLADGLWIGADRPGAVVNLTGDLVPELSVDRNKIRELTDPDAVEELLVGAVPALLAARAFRVRPEWLVELAEEFPRAADVVCEALIRADRTWSAAGDRSVPVAHVGLVPLDVEIVRAVGRPLPKTTEIYARVPDFIVYERLATWRRATEDRLDPADPSHVVAAPGDELILGDGKRLAAWIYREDWATALSLGRPGRAKILEWSSSRQRATVDLVRRLEARGATPRRFPPGADEPTADDLRLFRSYHDDDSPITSDEVSIGEVFVVAEQLGRDPRHVIDRVTHLGIEVTPRTGTRREAPAPGDITLCSLNLDGQASWWWGETVSWTHVVRAAVRTGRSVDEVTARFAALGYQVVGRHDQYRLDLRSVNGQLLGTEGWKLRERPLSIEFVADTALELGLPLAQVVRQFQEMGYAVASSLRVSATDRSPGTSAGSRGERHAGTPISRGRVFSMAHDLDRAPSEVAASLRAGGLTVADVRCVGERTLAALTSEDYAVVGWRSVASASRVVGAAYQQGTTPTALADRWAAAGVAVPALDGLPTSAESAILVSETLSGVSGWIDGPDQVGVAHALAAAIRLGRDEGDIARTLRGFGIAVADPAGLDSAAVGTADLLLISRVGDLAAPWVDDQPVGLAHVHRVAAASGRSPGEVVRRLREFGFSAATPEYDELASGDDRVIGELLNLPARTREESRPSSRASLLAAGYRTGRGSAAVLAWAGHHGLPIDHLHDAPRENVELVDLMWLSWAIDREGPWLPDGPITRGRVLSVAGAINRSATDVAHRYRELGFAVPDEYDSQLSPDAVDLALLSRTLGGSWEPLTVTTIPLAHVLRAACVFSCDVAEIVERYTRLGFTVPATREMTEAERAMATVAFFGADTADPRTTEVSLPQVLGVAEFLREPPRVVAETFAAVGLRLAVIPSDTPAVTPRDAFVLSGELNGHGPWLPPGPVPSSHVIAAAAHLRLAPRGVRDRLIQLGCPVSDRRGNRDDDVVDGNDAVLIETLTNNDGIYQDRPITRAEILYMSYRLRETPADIVRHYRALGFGVPTYD